MPEPNYIYNTIYIYIYVRDYPDNKWTTYFLKNLFVWNQPHGRGAMEPFVRSSARHRLLALKFPGRWHKFGRRITCKCLGSWQRKVPVWKTWVFWDAVGRFQLLQLVKQTWNQQFDFLIWWVALLRNASKKHCRVQPLLLDWVPGIPKPAGFSPPGDYILQPGPDVCYGADQFTCGVLEFNLKCSKDGGGFLVALACYGRLTFRVVDM